MKRQRCGGSLAPPRLSTLTRNEGLRALQLLMPNGDNKLVQRSIQGIVRFSLGILSSSGELVRRIFLVG